MGMKTEGIWHPCTKCWDEIPGLVDVTKRSLCTKCTDEIQKRDNAWADGIEEEIENGNLLGTEII